MGVAGHTVDRGTQAGHECDDEEGGRGGGHRSDGAWAPLQHAEEEGGRGEGGKKVCWIVVRWAAR